MIDRNCKTTFAGVFLTQPAKRSNFSFSRFQRDEAGSLLIFSIFLLIMMLMIAGMAVDLMRSETHRARLQSTLDRSVLAGASLDQELDAEAVVLDYFNKAGLGNYISAGDIQVVETPTSRTVTASARMTVDTYFMNMLGIDTLQALAFGQADESISDIEISLIVDVSGSMGSTSSSGQSKMQDLKDAAKEFVYLMQCDPDAAQPFDGICIVEPNTVSISLIPYNQQVFLGETLMQKFNTTEEHTISSCIDFATADFSSVPVELDPQVANPFASPDPTPNLLRTASVDIYGGWYGPNNNNWNNLSGYIWADDDYRECRPDPARSVVTFENDYVDLETAIDALYAGGNTSIDLGMKWGSALLDPSFNAAVVELAGSGIVVNDFSDRPYSYSRQRTQKVVVLMTDGKNTTQYKVIPSLRTGNSPYWYDASSGYISVYRSSTNRYAWYNKWRSYQGWNDNPKGGSNAVRLSYPEFWEMLDLRFMFDTRWVFSGPYPVEAVGNSAKNTNLDNICDAAKNAGIEVFTLGFETSSASSAVLESCASSGSHHFDVDGTDISVAFNSIARKIHELRLTN